MTGKKETIDMAELKDIEIFEAGTYRGKKYDDAALDTMVKNFNHHKDTLKPVAVIGHSEEQDLLTKSDLFSAGTMTSVNRIGSKLVASFKDVPQLLAELINKGAFKRISSEIYDNYKGMGNALRRVAILGGDIPEVKTLQDIAALYAETSEGQTTWVGFDEAEPKSNEKEKSDMEVKKFEELQAQVTKLSETVTAQATTIETLKAEKDQAITKLSEEQTKAKKAEIHQFCENLKRDGKLIPAMQDMGVEKFMEALEDTTVQKFAEGDKADDLSQLGFMKKFMEQFGKIVHFGETAGTGDAPKDEECTASEKLAKLTEKKIVDAKSAGTVISFADAFTLVQKENAELAAEYLAEIITK